VWCGGCRQPSPTRASRKGRDVSGEGRRTVRPGSWAVVRRLLCGCAVQVTLWRVGEGGSLGRAHESRSEGWTAIRARHEGAAREATGPRCGVHAKGELPSWRDLRAPITRKQKQTTGVTERLRALVVLADNADRRATGVQHRPYLLFAASAVVLSARLRTPTSTSRIDYASCPMRRGISLWSCSQIGRTPIRVNRMLRRSTSAGGGGRRRLELGHSMNA
jgi:hypothetical protein